MLKIGSSFQSFLKFVCLTCNTKSSAFKTYLLFFLLIGLLLSFAVWPPAASAKKVTIGWDANEEPDLLGYMVYRNTGKPGPPYNYSDDVAESELDDPLHPKVTLTGLQKDKEYYIALTAYNSDGVESSFSDDVCVKVVNDVVDLCSQSAPLASSSSSGGGGGGGGCFISTASTEASLFSQSVARPVIRSQVLAMLFLLVALIAAIRLGFNKKKKPLPSKS